MTPGALIHLPFPTRVRFPDLGTRPGTIETIDGGWVAVRFGAMTVRLPINDLTGDDANG